MHRITVHFITHPTHCVFNLPLNCHAVAFMWCHESYQWHVFIASFK